MNLTLIGLILCANLVAAAAASSNWNVPLYLWRSDASQHTALSTNAPSSYLLDLPGAAAASGNYSLVFADPVAFAFNVKEGDLNKPASYPLVTLKLYYSSERADLQSTTWSLAQLNAHGGHYQYLTTLGAVAVSPGSGYSAADFVPLTISYNAGTTDCITAPFSAEDVNELRLAIGSAGVDGGHSEYRTGGALIGFAARGTCSACVVRMSETFPSEGGADCAYACNVGVKGQANFDTTFQLGEMHTAAAEALKKSMLAADDIILSYGSKGVTVTPRSRGTHIHMSFNYFCCYSEEDIQTLHEVLDAYDWSTELSVSFDQPTIRIDSDAESVDHYSYILLLDQASQAKMHSLMDGLEAAVRAAGLDVHVPRRQQEPFHATLAVVNGRDFPAVAALAAVNAAVPAGMWTGNQGPIVLSKPTWNK